jgi:hypothetical protein
VCELTLAVSHPPTGEEQVIQEEPQSEEFDLIFIFYLVSLPLCNRYSDFIVTFISIHSVIICVVFFGACMRRTWLCPLKPGVTKMN